ncbi:phenylalanine--tRNA ligase subunit beta-related protein [Candidatus Venteria ishoeyi]|uniref:Phenylalanine--tRNA ligase beta subunit n=1 Tax=Candidatus Venteria ishoeyi TaxID=1899563 RepID=A0A1H6F6W0_9GAMM|nr:hypothetical protein [Candidatus Venteria ishoeyi]SEH05243.1 Phenylalanine--tRNA ligase beta subunit [Candidatus Venteria ishoeyi]
MVFAKVRLDPILSAKKKIIRYKEFSRVQDSFLDINFVMDRKFSIEKFLKIVKSSSKFIADIRITDIYEGENIERNTKAVAIKIIYQDTEKTLTDDQIQEQMKNLIEKMKKEEIVLR